MGRIREAGMLRKSNSKGVLTPDGRHFPPGDEDLSPGIPASWSDYASRVGC
jgi:hypothetical protein